MVKRHASGWAGTDLDESNDWKPMTEGMWPGQATVRDGEDDGPDYAKATLWLPDPESPSGWGSRRVWPKREAPAPRRRIGLGKHGEG